MLAKFRTVARGIGSKILMGLLILTFAIWGVEDMVRKPGGNITVATVGGMKIYKDEYDRALFYESEKLRRILGRQFSPELAKSLGLESQILQNIIDNRLLILESKRLGLRISDEEVVNNIRKSQEFLDDKGKFSKSVFEGFVRSRNQTEKAFIQQVREDMMVSLLLTTLSSAISVPENAAPFLLSAREEQRSVDIYTISPEVIKSIPSPDEKQLKDYYDSHIAEFTAPEYRTLGYVLLTKDDAKKSVEISGKKIEAAYRERIEEFKKPERRRVEQLLFGNEEAARKAYNLIKEGKPFEQVARDSNILNPKAVSLGIVEKTNIPEEAASQVFALENGAVSEPVKSSFGWHIFRVKEIIPAMTESLEEVRPRLEKELEQQENENALTELSNRLEDSIAGGSTLSEAAKEFGLKLITLPPIDKNGLLADGTLAKNLPEDDKFLETAFKTEEKTESSLVSGRSGENYIVRVDSITPERVKNLEEVKSKLDLSWIEQEKKKQLAASAKKIAADFAATSTRTNVIKAYSLQSPSTIVVSQKKDDGQKLPAAMVTDIFSLPVGAATSAFEQKNGEEYIIAVIKGIIYSPTKEKNPEYDAKLSNISNEYKNSMQNEVIEQYLRFLATKYPISVNIESLETK